MEITEKNITIGTTSKNKIVVTIKTEMPEEIRAEVKKYAVKVLDEIPSNTSIGFIEKGLQISFNTEMAEIHAEQLMNQIEAYVRLLELVIHRCKWEQKFENLMHDLVGQKKLLPTYYRVSVIDECGGKCIVRKKCTKEQANDIAKHLKEAGSNPIIEPYGNTDTQ